MSNKPLTPDEAVKWALDMARAYGMKTQPNTNAAIWTEWERVKGGSTRTPTVPAKQEKPTLDASDKTSGTTKKFKGFTTGS
jgi:hypothetical protein